jgi:N6-L-threonylcarbamoyladenine synthase
MTTILAIETSCDETAAAVVVDGRQVLSSVVSSQVERHSGFGGVVPEVAGRAHLELLGPVVREALSRAGVDGGDLDAVGATIGPGLIGSLLVGVSAAKAYSQAWGVPFVGVNHMEGHLHAAFLEDPELALPAVVLLVSGGHTMLINMLPDGRYRLLGQTIDDAAGEAYGPLPRPRLPRRPDHRPPGRPGQPGGG